MTTTIPTHLAHFLDGRPVCWGEHESGDADRTRYPDRVTCDHCKAEVSRSAGMGDAEQTVRVVLEALLATGHKIVPDETPLTVDAVPNDDLVRRLACDCEDGIQCDVCRADDAGYNGERDLKGGTR